MEGVTAGQFQHIGDGVYVLRDDESIQVDVKEPSRPVEDALARHNLFCANLGSFYYQLRKRAGLLGTGPRGSHSPATRDTPWHRAVREMNELLRLIASNIEQGRVELAESNLGAINDVVAKLLAAGHEWLKKFKPLVEKRAQIEQQISVLEKELGDRVQLAREFTSEQIDQLVSMNVISEKDAQAAKELQALTTELDEVNRHLRAIATRRQARRTVSRSGTKVRIADLLQEGIIAPGTMFRLRQTGTDAIVTDSGQLDVEGTRFDSPSGAAKAVLDRAANGWREWTFQDSDRRWKAIDELRRRLLNEWAKKSQIR